MTKTALGKDIPANTRGILYLCELNRQNKTLTVEREILFDNSFSALNAYANIPNPESQLVTGRTHDELINELNILHECMQREEWVEDLMECI